MLALVIVLIVVVALLAVVTTGLLRSHADIIKALHDLGVGVGDPGTSGAGDVPVALQQNRGVVSPLPSERSSNAAYDLSGVDPDGDAVSVSMAASDLTLITFLSSGCTSCAAFWEALAMPARLALLPAGTRVVISTKGPEMESPEAIKQRRPAGITIVMSSQAWDDYEVPGSPFFALVDGRTGRRIGEGVGTQFEQIVELVLRAQAEAGGPRSASTSRAAATGLNGDEREAANDADLMSAGIGPGHPSLYPQSLDDIFESTAHLARPEPAPQKEGD